jgi:hypothetical protein
VLLKGRYVPLKDGKFCDKPGEVFDGDDCKPADLALLLSQESVEPYTEPVKSTKEVRTAPITKPVR